MEYYLYARLYSALQPGTTLCNVVFPFPGKASEISFRESELTFYSGESLSNRASASCDLDSAGPITVINPEKVFEMNLLGWRKQETSILGESKPLNTKIFFFRKFAKLFHARSESKSR